MKKLKVLFYLSILGIILSSCEAQEDYIENTSNTNTFKRSSKSFGELITEKDFSRSFSKIPKRKIKKTNSFERTQMEDSYGFTIYDTPINIMESDSLLVYNLLIKSDTLKNGNYFENLVLNTNKFTNETKAYIFKYNLTSDIVPTIHNSVSFNASVNIKPIMYSGDLVMARYGDICYTHHYALCYELAGDGVFSQPHTPTEYCSGAKIVNFSEEVCIDSQGGGATGIPTNTTSGSSSNSSGGSSYGSTGGTPIYSNPTPPCDPRVDCPFLEEVNYSDSNIQAFQNYLLNDNPLGLLDVPCSQIPYWQTIAQYQVPQYVKDKISNIDSQTGWFTSAGIQTLNDSNNGAVVNMDFFPVTITQMPKKSNGELYTQKELFDYVRTHINDFFDSLQFTPIVDTNYGINDSILWQSNNPLSSILSINIVGNEGSVVCSNFNIQTGEWYFSTITAPWDGSHPVSGNRAFGYYTDVNGNMVIYTRGIDRLTDGTYMYGPNGILAEAAQQAVAFSQADSKWSNFQTKIKNFINSGQSTNNNGNSIVNIPVKYRPNWSKVKNVLKGTRPISDLGCK